MAQNFVNEQQGYGSNFSAGHDGLGLLGLLGLMGRRGDKGRKHCEHDYKAELSAILQQAGEIRRDSAESEARLQMSNGELRRDVSESAGEIRRDLSEDAADIREAISEGVSKLRDTAHKSDLAILASIDRVEDRMCDNEKELLKVTHLLSKEGFEHAIDVKNQVREFEAKVSDKLCRLESQAKDHKQDILNVLAANKLDEKNERIAELLAERAHLHHRIELNQEFTAIRSQLQDVTQGQKTIQFGNGTVTQKASNSQA